MRFWLGVVEQIIATAVCAFLGPFVLAAIGGETTDIHSVEINIGSDIVKYWQASPRDPDPPPRRDSQVSANLACTDRHGHGGAFQAMVFLDSYNWVRGSTELVEFNGEVIPYFPTVLRQRPVQKILSQAVEIVAVGTASCESPWGFLVENHRARQRAEQLVRWIEESRDTLPSHPDAPLRNVIPLSLGRYNKECAAAEAAETSRQRRIVLIAVTEHPKGLDLESCLQRRMQEDPSLEFLTDNYSRFDLDAGWKS